MNLWLRLSSIDHLVFSGFLCVLLIIIFKTRFKAASQISSFDYIVMSRRLTLPLFVATLVVSWYGGIFGTTQIAFEHGIYNFITQGVFWYVSYIIFAFLFVRKIHDRGALTLPQLISKSYGKNSAKLTAYLLLFKSLPIAYSISIGILIKLIFGLTLYVSIIVGTSFVICYTCFSNFRSIVFIDILQFLLMYACVILVVIYSIKTMGSPQILLDKLPDHYFQVNGKHHVSTTFLWIFIALSTTLLSPAFYQRCIAAKDIKTMRFGIMVSVLLWMVFDVCVTIGAMYAKVHLPHAESMNAYLLYGLEILPSGLRGLFLIGMVAIVLSTLDAFLFITSTLVSHDLMPIKYQNSSIVRALSILVVGILTIVLALQFNGNIEYAWIIMEGYFAAILIIPFIWTYFVNVKISDKQFIIITILSLTTMLIKDLLYKHINIEAFYYGIIVTIISYIIVTICNCK